MQQYLIIGNGVAGTTAAENIRRNDSAGEITIVTDEDLPFYYRVRLTDFLGGGLEETELVARKKEWYDEKKIRLKLRTKITQIHSDKRIALAGDGSSFFYDRLLLANGSHPFIPPITGSELDGVHAIHTIADVRRISKAAEKIKEVVLIGGGLLGLETANALHRRGKKITVVEFFPRLLPRQLDPDGAARLQHIFENMGFTFRLGAITRKITGGNRARQVILENGAVLPADMVIISAGVRPNLALAQSLGLETDKGLIVDQYMRTSGPDIFAAGDIVEFVGKTYGIWPAAMEQGRIAGLNMSGSQLTAYEGTVLSNILKVAGIDLASAGEIDAENRFTSRIVNSDGVYKKVVMNHDRVIGCIMLGDRKNFNRINKAISTGENILETLDTLLNA